MSVNPIIPAGTPVQRAIAVASRKTGMDFDYLLGQAQVESGMRADAHAPTSSATGLYQFIEQSWLQVMKQHGAEHGLGWAADAIQQGAGGRFYVSDPNMRQSILDMRNDPQTAALMAAEHAADNKVALESSLGRAATGTDLYMAHFLGLGGARSFLGAMEANPGRSGAAMFPAAARANRNVFYDGSGQPRSLGEIYQRFAAKLDNGAASVGATGLASDSLDGAGSFGGQAPQLEVVLGRGAIDGDRQWLANAFDRMAGGASDSPRPEPAMFNASYGNLGSARSLEASSAIASARAFRPTPETARLAYLMLASLGA
ncbi:lytic transglycosylase domain-containing protein [Stakelama marina]|uniref:Lytic transglycosylase domain-containing protein n=1 Tax=Stakelama marina TaxID=2826939 RepID=A0A8T4IEY9_9SPHN|nr:lytic transglycosylase domain-containing protein [Stakelama marina]MBR0553123.1 lytic transglycosylase domain-containing protein [Stakelama marina]